MTQGNWLGLLARHCSRNNPPGWDDLLVGYDFSILDLEDRTHTRTTTGSFYFTDNWRVTSRLTLNLGTRWEIVPHAYDVQNRLSNFYQNLYDPAKAPQFNADGASLNTSSPGFSAVTGVPLSGIPSGHSDSGRGHGSGRDLRHSVRATLAHR